MEYFHALIDTHFFVYFSVLIGFHNDLVELLRSEIDANGKDLGLGPLKDIVIDLSKREISILQIAESKLGVISINEADCRWIEQLARATLDKEDSYFLTSGSPLNFQFIYFQTYLVRTYLLYCGINDTHFESKYQFYVQPHMPSVVERHNDIADPELDVQNEQKWDHLKFNDLDRLQNEFQFIQMIKNLLNTDPQNYSMMMLSEFVQLDNEDYQFARQYEKYQISDFRLSQIENICGFYQQAIIRVQNAYNHVSTTIDVPISEALALDLDRIFTESFLFENSEPEKEKLEQNKRVITDFLEELKDVHEDLARQSSQPFATTCEYWGFESFILGLIPVQLKCENYVPLCVKLIEIRSQLEERNIAIREKNEVKWSPYSLPSDMQMRYPNQDKQNIEHTIEPEILFDELSEEEDKDLHLAPSMSRFKSLDEGDNELIDLDANNNEEITLIHSPTNLKDFDADQNTSERHAELHFSFDNSDEDEISMKDPTESRPNFEDNDETEPNHTVLNQSTFDALNEDEDQFVDLSDPHLSLDIVDVPEGITTSSIQVHPNPKDFARYEDQQRNSVQLTSHDENIDKPKDEIPHLASTQFQLKDSYEHEELTEKESTHPHQLHLPSSFQLKMRTSSLNPSSVFVKTHELAENLKSRGKHKRFEITFADETTENKLSGDPEKHYTRLKTAFEEKKYSLDSMAIVDSLNLLIDHTKIVLEGYLSRTDAKYRVVNKTTLIPIKIEFEGSRHLYQATESANISSILTRLIIDENLQFNSLDDYFSVFDMFGWYIAEDCPLSKLYRLDNRSSIDIRMVRWGQQMKICEISRTDPLDNTNEVKPTIDYFHLTTKWQQVGLRLNSFTPDTQEPIGNVYFWDITKNIIISNDEKISLSIKESHSTDILILQEKHVMSVLLSYDQINVRILIPRQCSVDHLLTNQIYLNQLNLRTLSPDYILTFISPDSGNRSLTNNEMTQPIQHFESSGRNNTHFQINILIKIFPCGRQKEESIPIPHRNFTVHQLLQRVEIDEDFKYLASYGTKMILPFDLSLSTIPDSHFFLVQEDQIGCLCIRRTTNDKGLSQQYITDTTIDDIYKQNKINEENQCLMLDNDFVPSRQTSFNLFLSTSKTDPVIFTMIDKKPPVNLTVTNKEDNRSISFRCSHSILASRILEIVCTLWKLKSKFYRLKTTDETILDSQDSIADYNESIESIDDLQMILETKVDTKCTISYQERSITIPIDDEVQASAMIEEALQILCIPLDQKNRHGLFLVDIPDGSTRFESNDSIKELRESLDESPKCFHFELRVI